MQTHCIHSMVFMCTDSAHMFIVWVHLSLFSIASPLLTYACYIDSFSKHTAPCMVATVFRALTRKQCKQSLESADGEKAHYFDINCNCIRVNIDNTNTQRTCVMAVESTRSAPSCCRSQRHCLRCWMRDSGHIAPQRCLLDFSPAAVASE